MSTNIYVSCIQMNACFATLNYACYQLMYNDALSSCDLYSRVTTNQHLRVLIIYKRTNICIKLASNFFGFCINTILKICLLRRKIS